MQDRQTRLLALTDSVQQQPYVLVLPFTVVAWLGMLAVEVVAVLLYRAGAS